MECESMETLSAMRENPLTYNVMLSELHTIQSGQIEKQRLSVNPSLSLTKAVSVSQYSAKPRSNLLKL